MSKWEYKTLSKEIDRGLINCIDLDKRLNELGEEGWELLSVTPVHYDSVTKSVVHHFRRAKGDKQPAGFRP
jgi:hypothetical protein